MSAFIGPNLYQILSALGTGSCKLKISGGKPANGTVVQTYNYDSHVNGQFVIASVGLGKSGKEEYLNLNRTSHTYLMAPAAADLKNYAEPTGGINAGPFDERARWNIIPLNNGSGRYIFVDSPFSSYSSFSPSSSSSSSSSSVFFVDCNLEADLPHSKNGNKVILYATKDDASHWFLRLAPDAISNSPKYEETL
ncbi:hypothetical protein Q7P35_001286 [Cladosporium inversicolor]